MVYHFSITTPESRNFHLEVEMDGEHTFYDFHTIIQKSLGFEPHHLASFFISDKNGRKTVEISLLYNGYAMGAFLTMQRTGLFRVIGLNPQQLYYTYDFISDRSLNIELTGIVMERNLKEPMVTLKQGDAPVQVYEDESYVPEAARYQEEEVLMDFGILDDYTELYGEMEDY